jgi:hypothetical protein
MTRPLLPAAQILAALLLIPGLALASEGHDHDHGDAPAATGPALPRFAAVSETFELVGVLAGRQLTLYLDRSTDNSPVTEAQIELDIAGVKYQAGKHGTDEFEVVLAQVPAPGVLPITAMVTAGNEVDLLAGELDIHEAAHAEEPAPSHTHAWYEYAGWVGGGIAALVLLGLAGRRWAAALRLRTGGAA